MEIKDKDKRKRKLCWYDIILIVSILVFVLLLILSKSVETSNPWLSNLAISLATSLIFGATLSYIFAYISERNGVVTGFKRELNEIFRNLKILMVNLSTKWSENRDILAHELVENLPHIYDIERLYPKYKNDYYEFRKNLIEKIQKTDLVTCILEIHTMTDKTLILQELFYQEYLGEEKKPIGGQIVLIINDPIKDYGTLYSNKRRNFNSKKRENKTRTG